MDKKIKDLYSALYILSIELIDIVNQKKEDRGEEIIAIPFQKVSATSLKIEEYQISFFYDWDKVEYFYKYEWANEALINLVQKELPSNNNYKKVRELITACFNIEDIYVPIGLSTFLFFLAKKAPGEKDIKSNIEEYINLFINDLEIGTKGKLNIWYINVWLENIYIETDSVEITDRFLFKRPIEKEYDLTEQKRHVSAMEKFYTKIDRPVLKMFFSVEDNEGMQGYPSSVNKIIENWEIIFRLFKPFSVYARSLSTHPRSILKYAFEYQLNSYGDLGVGNVLKIKPSEIDILASFYSKMLPFINLYEVKSIKTNPYDIALCHYNEFLIENTNSVKKVMLSMRSIESILSNTSFNIVKRLKSRIITLLKYWSISKEEIETIIDSSYLIRNATSHGSPISEELRNFADANCYKLININRICLIAFIQLRDKFDKEELIEIIDNASKDESSYENLKKIFDENVFIPLVEPYENAHIALKVIDTTSS